MGSRGRSAWLLLREPISGRPASYARVSPLMDSRRATRQGPQFQLTARASGAAAHRRPDSSRTSGPEADLEISR